MPNITAKVIADSVSPEGIRLTTMQIRLPKFILAEFNTHRMFSRNFASTRAIPTKKLIDVVRTDPFKPVSWGSNQKGMQAGEQIDESLHPELSNQWHKAVDAAADAAEQLLNLGLHKQWAGRLIEPFMMVSGVVTATNYANFFALRAHPDAQPEIRILAEAMMAAMGQSDPELLVPGDWHLPYIDSHGRGHVKGDLSTPAALEIAKKVSIARCARVSYLTHDGRPTTVEEDLALYEKLVVSRPLHASPSEHQATPDAQWSNMGGGFDQWKHPELHGNLCGFIQYRKTLPNEFVAG